MDALKQSLRDLQSLRLVSPDDPKWRTSQLTFAKRLNVLGEPGETIEEAFARMRNESYGVCTNCGATIGEKRLLAVPWTPFCIDCQELQEKGLLG